MAEYIEKDKIINLLEHNDKIYHYADRGKENIVYDTVQTLCRVIIEAEAADVQPVRRGTWKLIYSDEHGTAYHCSNCKLITCTDKTINSPLEREEYFCQRCGADMRGEDSV